MPLRAPRALRPAAALALGIALLAALEVDCPKPAVAAVRQRPRLLAPGRRAGVSPGEVAPLLIRAPNRTRCCAARGELNALLEALHGGELERARRSRSCARSKRSSSSPTPRARTRPCAKRCRRSDGRSRATRARQARGRCRQSGRAEAARAELERLAERVAQETEARRRGASWLEHARAAGPPPAERDAAEGAPSKSCSGCCSRKPRRSAGSGRRTAAARQAARARAAAARSSSSASARSAQLDDLRRDLSSTSPSLQGSARRRSGRTPALRAANKLQDAAQRQKSAQQRGQLGERLAQLRELLSKQGARQAPGPAAQGQRKQARRSARRGQRLDMDKFARAARGQQGKPSGCRRAGDQPKPPDGALLMPGQRPASARPRPDDARRRRVELDARAGRLQAPAPGGRAR